MPDDFFKTSEVMAKGAAVLYQAGEWRNTCYLAGYVLECGLKAVLEGPLTQQAAASQNVLLKGPRHYSHNVVKLAGILAGLGVPDLSTLAPVMAGNWDPNERYDGSRWTQRHAPAFMGEAQAIHMELCRLRLNGSI